MYRHTKQTFFSIFSFFLNALITQNYYHFYVDANTTMKNEQNIQVLFRCVETALKPLQFAEKKKNKTEVKSLNL